MTSAKLSLVPSSRVHRSAPHLPTSYSKWQITDHIIPHPEEQDLDKIELYQPPRQKTGELTVKQAAAECVMQERFLVTVCSLETWRDRAELVSIKVPQARRVFYLGTAYKDADGDACYRCLAYDEHRRRWQERFVLASTLLEENDYIAVMK